MSILEPIREDCRCNRNSCCLCFAESASVRSFGCQHRICNRCIEKFSGVDDQYSCPLCTTMDKLYLEDNLANFYGQKGVRFSLSRSMPDLSRFCSYRSTSSSPDTMNDSNSKATCPTQSFFETTDSDNSIVDNMKSQDITDQICNNLKLMKERISTKTPEKEEVPDSLLDRASLCHSTGALPTHSMGIDLSDIDLSDIDLSDDEDDESSPSPECLISCFSPSVTLNPLAPNNNQSTVDEICRNLNFSSACDERPPIPNNMVSGLPLYTAKDIPKNCSEVEGIDLDDESPSLPTLFRTKSIAPGSWSMKPESPKSLYEQQIFIDSSSSSDDEDSDIDINNGSLFNPLGCFKNKDQSPLSNSSCALTRSKHWSSDYIASLRKSCEDCNINEDSSSSSEENPFSFDSNSFLWPGYPGPYKDNDDIDVDDHFNLEYDDDDDIPAEKVDDHHVQEIRAPLYSYKNDFSLPTVLSA